MGFDFISWYSMYTLEIDQGLETWISSIIGLQKGKLKEIFVMSNILAGLIIFNILFTVNNSPYFSWLLQPHYN